MVFSARELQHVVVTAIFRWRVCVITICSRCKRTISETFEKGSEKKVSHGICSRCLAVLESEIREGPRADDNHEAQKAAPLLAKDP